MQLVPLQCGEYMRLQKDGCDCKDDHTPGELAPSPSENSSEADADAAEVGKKKKVEEEKEGASEEDDEDDAAEVVAQMKRDKVRLYKL
jgi:hypothetical protein